jgi:hypothetical protein
MTWSTSFIVASTLAEALAGGTAIDLADGAPNWKIALFDNTVTPDPDADPQHYGAGAWASGECTGTNWPAGGVPLSLAGAGLTHAAGGILKFAAGNVSVANTTISDPVQGALIYNSALSGLALCAVWFGGSGYTTSASPLGITWPASGVWNISMVPGG